MFHKGHLEGTHLMGLGGAAAGSEGSKHAICLDQMLLSGRKTVMSLGLYHHKNWSKILKYSKVS